jgi:hypothetical protein
MLLIAIERKAHLQWAEIRQLLWEHFSALSPRLPDRGALHYLWGVWVHYAYIVVMQNQKEILPVKDISVKLNVKENMSRPAMTVLANMVMLGNMKMPALLPEAYYAWARQQQYYRLSDSKPFDRNKYI